MSAARVAALEEAVRDLVTDCGDRGCECCRSSAALRARHRLLLSDSADRRTPEADPLDALDQADAEALARTNPMASPSLLGWWVVLAGDQPMAIVKEITLAREFEKLCRSPKFDMGQIRTVRAETRADVIRLQRGEAVLDALEREGIGVMVTLPSQPNGTPQDGNG